MLLHYVVKQLIVLTRDIVQIQWSPMRKNTWMNASDHVRYSEQRVHVLQCTNDRWTQGIKVAARLLEAKIKEGQRESCELEISSSLGIETCRGQSDNPARGSLATIIDKYGTPASRSTRLYTMKLDLL